MTHRASHPIALVGLSGAGKSAVARLLGQRLDATVVDLDRMIEDEQGATIAALFERRGQAFFRGCETAALARALAAAPGVIACGGGIVLDPANRETLRRRCHTVWLEVDPRDAAARIGDAASGRPLIGTAPLDRLATLLLEREALYAEVAHARVVTTGRTPEQVADDVLATLDGRGR